MHEDLERLDVIDRIDREDARQVRIHDKAHQSVADATAQVLDTDQALAALADASEALKIKERALQRELEESRRYQARATQVLETGIGDPDAAERQLQKLGERLDGLETDMLEILELQDVQAAQKASLLAQRAERQTRLDQANAALPIVEAEVKAERAALATQRLVQWAPMAREVQERYLDFQHKKRWAVAHIVDGACNSCQRVVNQQHITDLNRGLLKPCMGCSRWLVP